MVATNFYTLSQFHVVSVVIYRLRCESANILSGQVKYIKSLKQHLFTRPTVIVPVTSLCTISVHQGAAAVSFTGHGSHFCVSSTSIVPQTRILASLWLVRRLTFNFIRPLVGCRARLCPDVRSAHALLTFAATWGAELCSSSVLLLLSPTRFLFAKGAITCPST